MGKLIDKALIQAEIMSDENIERLFKNSRNMYSREELFESERASNMQSKYSEIHELNREEKAMRFQALHLEILDRFNPEFIEKQKYNAQFQMIVNSLMRGANAYELLEMIITALEEQTKHMIDIAQQSSSPILRK